MRKPAQRPAASTADPSVASNDPIKSFLMDFAARELSTLRMQGIQARKPVVREWRSFENPREQTTILELTLDLKATEALELWASLSNELARAIEAAPADIRTRLRRNAALSVDWR